MTIGDLAHRYLHEVARAGVCADALTQAADRSDLLRVAYGGRYLSRPVFLDVAAWQGLERDLGGLHDLLASLPGRLFDGSLDRFCAAVGMSADQAAAVLRTADETPVRLARADLYRDGGGFRVLEFNMTSALGGFENAEINRALLEAGVLREFVDRERLAYVDTLAQIVDTMMDWLCRGDRLHAAGRPVVAFADWPVSFPTFGPRLEFMAKLVEPLGIDGIACHVGHLRPRDGRLFVDDRAVDVVYRFFLIEDLLGGPEALEIVEPLLSAHERGTVAMFSPLDVEMYGNKRALGLLSDHRYRDAFTAGERELIDRFLPWTRELRDGSTTVDGAEVDLVDYCREHRPSLVLKPSLLHGGIGVSTGWTMTPEQWADALRAALDDGPYVVQRRVVPQAEPFPAGEPGAHADRALNWGMFLTAAGYGGGVVRGTADPDVGIVSMSGGALVGCCFHERPPDPGPGRGPGEA